MSQYRREEEEKRPQSPQMARRSGTVKNGDNAGVIVKNDGAVHIDRNDDAEASPQMASRPRASSNIRNNDRCRHLSPEVARVASIDKNNEGISYPGGKGNLFQKLINLIPPHQTYIEAFLGGGAVLRNKRPAACSIAIDADTAALEAVRSLIDTNDGNTWLFLNQDSIKWLAGHNIRGDEFIYADPPYVMTSRKQHRRLYRYELADQDHKNLLAVLTRVPCPVMISGYWSDLYEQSLAGWQVQTFEVMTRGGSWATEYVWMNYPTPIELHDYSFLGDDFRERERIKRKKQRWVKRLQTMPILERQALMSAIASLDDRI